MNAVEFEAKINNGVVEVPVQYSNISESNTSVESLQFTLSL